MSKFGWFVLGALSLLVIQVLVTAILLAQARGFSARESPSGIERWIARLVLGASLPAGVAATANPVAKTPEALAEARAHWADHCAVCHANDGSGDTRWGDTCIHRRPTCGRPALSG